MCFIAAFVFFYIQIRAGHSYNLFMPEYILNKFDPSTLPFYMPRQRCVHLYMKRV